MKQFGRSMIEMLGVLAIIAVLSIGGLLGYRRAVNNHHANTILDDVNRFAFVILEKSGLPLGENIDKGDFKESGLYQLTGFQGEDAGQFAITVKDIPNGVCEPLIDKAIIEYKVGVTPAGHDQSEEILYDTLNTDLCQEMNDMTFYFGDISGICNEPDESGYTPCTENSDCCGGYFCAFENPISDTEQGDGTCRLITAFVPETKTMSDGLTWTHSTMPMTWWSGRSWCRALGKSPTSRSNLGCGKVASLNTCSSSIVLAIREEFKSRYWHWLEGSSAKGGYTVIFTFSPYPKISTGGRSSHHSDYDIVALCH